MNLIDLLKIKKVKPPLKDEIEVSVFGAGIGECIVIHFGFGKWMVVDSCAEPGTKYPIALEYLKFLGVNVAEDVELFVVTHWHDDHTKGARHILAECNNAEIAISDACTIDEFRKMISLQKTHSLVSETKVDEYVEIYKNLRSSKKFHFASNNKTVIKMKIGESSKYDVVIEALSPSSEEMLLSKEMFAKYAAVLEGESKKVVLNSYPNHTAVVIWISINGRCILLGSDLERSSNQNCGWQAALTSYRTGEKAEIYKIPHHGSENAHLDDVWSKMLHFNPKTFVTTFLKGRALLPKKTDIDRILSFTDTVYVSSEVKPRSSKRRDNSVDRAIKGMVKQLRHLENHMGLIQYRSKITDSDGTVELYGLAKRHNRPSAPSTGATSRAS